MFCAPNRTRVLISAALVLAGCVGVRSCSDEHVAPSRCGRLVAGQRLVSGQSLVSCGGRFRLAMQVDGNLVLSQGAKTLTTLGQGAGPAVMQADGDFVLYSTAGQPLWNTHTGGHSGAYLVLQDDGDVVIDSARGVLWASNTGVPPGPRAVRVKVPSGYTRAKAWPLIIELHPLGGDADQVESYFRMMSLADANGVFVIAPSGTASAPPATTFWNATDGCCDMHHSQVDDVAYLRSLITWAKARYNIDPRRVHVIGLSNGGFMAHRMACDAADLVASVISVAGAVWKDPARCKPVSPVGVLQIHGTADAVVPFNGTAAFAPGPVPAATYTYESWATRNGCAGPDATSKIDFDPGVPGAETMTFDKSEVPGCRARTELWVDVGGGHVPTITPAYSQVFINWFLSNPKP